MIGCGLIPKFRWVNSVFMAVLVLCMATNPLFNILCNRKAGSVINLCVFLPCAVISVLPLVQVLEDSIVHQLEEVLLEI